LKHAPNFVTKVLQPSIIYLHLRAVSTTISQIHAQYCGWVFERTLLREITTAIPEHLARRSRSSTVPSGFFIAAERIAITSVAVLVRGGL